MLQTKTGAAGVALWVNVLLIVAKVSAGVISGSVSIVAQAIDSLLDLFASLINFFGLRFAARPADREHPFGHGKMEAVSGSVQAGLIFAAAAYILYQSIDRLLHGATVRYITVGVAVMAACIVVDVLLARYLRRTARETDSIALEAYARNITTDIYSMSAVLVGLLVVRFTNLVQVDAAIAIVVALVILKTAYDVLKRSYQHIIDVRLPSDEETVIESCIQGHIGELAGYHRLRTRKSGSDRHVDVHLVMPASASVQWAHDMCDHLEAEIRAKLSNAQITIHVEPCDGDCSNCPTDCPQDQAMPGP